MSGTDNPRETPTFGPNTACPSFGKCGCSTSCIIADKALRVPGVIEAGALLMAVQKRQAELRYIDRGGLPFVRRDQMFEVVNEIARERFGSAWYALVRGEVTAESLAVASEAPRVVDVDSFADDKDVYAVALAAFKASGASRPHVVEVFVNEDDLRAAVDAVSVHERVRIAAVLLSAAGGRRAEVERLRHERDAARAERDQIAQDFDDLKRRYEEIMPPTARAAGKRKDVATNADQG